MNPDLSWFASFFSGVWGVLFMVLLLGGSIFVHELGHFLAARWRGLKVDRFSIGFGPRMFGWKGRDGVDYRISWLPLGGYVALPQLADVRAIEGEPTEEPRTLPKITYLDKCIVVVAGVVFNLIFALAIALVLWPFGVPTSAAAKTNVIGYVAPVIDTDDGALSLRELAVRHARGEPSDHEVPGPAKTAGLEPGDRILAVDGSPVRDYRDYAMAIALGSGQDDKGRRRVVITYERDGMTRDTEIFPAMVTVNPRSGDSFRQIGIGPAQKLQIGSVAPNSPAARADLHKGDQLLALNGQKLYSLDQFFDLIDANGTQPAILSILRDGQTLEKPVQLVRLPTTTPLATISVENPAWGGAAQTPAKASLDVLPIYPRDSTGNPASPVTKAASLKVWRLKNLHGAFGSIQVGDYLEQINGQPVSSVQQAVDALRATPPGKAATITYSNETEKFTTTLEQPFAAAVTPPEEVTRLGATFSEEFINDHVPPFQQFADAIKQTLATLGSLINPRSDVGLHQLSGPIGIGRALYQFSVQDLREALWLTFVINVNLAILNLLPIPVLDGGHLLLFTIARLRRRELPVNFVAAAQGLSLVLLMGLIVYVFYNDSLRWVGDRDRDREATRYDLYNLDRSQVTFPAAAVPGNDPATTPPKP